jgi:trimeric autotransporter adhesin
MARRSRPAISAEQLESREVPATAFALGTGGIGANTLFRFDTATPATLSVGIPVTGLGLGETLVGTDFRPANGQLYGLAVDATKTNVHLYTINPNSGAATAVGAAVPVTGLTTATKFGVDFNPVVDRLRVVTDVASDDVGAVINPNVNNFRINPNNGTLAGIDPDLTFTAPATGPEVSVAYTNNDSDTTTATTLLGIDSRGRPAGHQRHGRDPRCGR